MNEVGTIEDWPPDKETLRNLYWKKRLSIQKIRNLYGKGSGTVQDLMRSQGVKTRTLSQAMTRYMTKPFSGDANERAYLLGFRVGDLFATRHGHNVRAKVSTTHPAMIELFRKLFARYSHVTVSPKKLRKWNLYEWEVYSYLHPSFEFLRLKPSKLDGPFLSLFAGFFDAEGCICIKKASKSRSTRVTLEVANNNLGFLKFYKRGLDKLGYSPTISPSPYHEKGQVIGFGKYNRDLWRLSMMRNTEVMGLLSLLPIQHREKIWKRELANLCYDKPWKYNSNLVRALRQQIKGEVRTSVGKAKKAYLTNIDAV